MLAYWALSSSCVQVHGSLLPESMHNLHPWHHGQFCHLGNDKCDWGKNSLVSTEQVILFTLWLKSFSAELTFWWAMTWGTNIFTIFATKRGLSTHLFPRILCHQIFSHVASKSLTIQLKHWPQPTKWYLITHLPFLLSGKVNCLNFCPLVGGPFTTVLQGSQKKWL